MEFRYTACPRPLALGSPEPSAEFGAAALSEGAANRPSSCLEGTGEAGSRGLSPAHPIGVNKRRSGALKHAASLGHFPDASVAGPGESTELGLGLSLSREVENLLWRRCLTSTNLAEWPCPCHWR